MTDTEQILKRTCLLGRGILENGGEIYRVEDSMERMFIAYDIKNPQIFAIPATIIVTVEDDEGNSYTHTERILSYSHNMQKLDRYNTLCRKVCKNKPSPSEITDEINKIKNLADFKELQQVVGHSVAAGFFCLFWGGSLYDFVVALIAGALARVCLTATSKLKSDFFFSNVCASAVISVTALFACLAGFGQNMDMIIIGAIMLCVPGVAITNIMRDIIRGDVITGTIKIAEVLLTAAAIATGTGIPIAIMNIVAGGAVI